MEDLSFDISSILTDEEAKQLFENPATETKPETEQKNEPAEEESPEKEKTGNPSEKVGEEENEIEENAISQRGDGASPNVYSSIASALKKDGIFPDFDDKELEGDMTPDKFAELVEKTITQRMDERTRRIDEALRNGVQPDAIRSYEQTISYLDSIDEDALSAEGEEGEALRKQFIYNDLINRGYTQEKAMRELEKSLKTGSDVDDAKDALESLKGYYKKEYANLQEEAKKRADSMKDSQKRRAEEFKKMVLESEVSIGDLKLDKKTCQKVYDAVTKPTYKDEKTGRLLTEVQKFQKEKPLEFLKQLGLWFVLTDGGKNMTGFTKEQLRTEKNKGIRELETMINSTDINPDGTLKYASSGGDAVDVLLSDKWKIGF